MAIAGVPTLGSPDPRWYLVGGVHPAFLAKLGATVLCLWLVARRVDGALLWHSLASLSPGFVLAAFPCFLLIGVLGGLRWWLVLRGLGQSATLGEVTAVFWAGMALNQFLPSAAGDAARAVLCTRAGVRAEPAIASILLERVFMVLALLVILVATQPLLGRYAPGMANMKLATVLLAAGAGGFALLAVADLCFPFLARFSVTRWMTGIAASARRLAALRRGPGLFAFSLLGNLNFVVAAWLLGCALGLGLPFGAYLAAMPVAVVVTVIPISVGGWGLREGVLVALLGRAGVQADEALAFSLLFGAMSAVACLPGLIPLWQRSGRTTAG